MLDGTGSLVAVSVTFTTKRAAVAGIAQAREIAGTGLVRDRSAGGQAAPAGPLTRMTRRTAGGAGRSTSLGGGSLAAGKRTRAHH
jgi:hypothetical protein